VVNTLNASRNGAIGFIHWLNEHCPNSLWRTTAAVRGLGEVAAFDTELVRTTQ
jgi:hypothetical protein